MATGDRCPMGRFELPADGLDPDNGLVAFDSIWNPWDSHAALYRYPVEALAPLRGRARVTWGSGGGPSRVAPSPIPGFGPRLVHAGPRCDPAADNGAPRRTGDARGDRDVPMTRERPLDGAPPALVARGEPGN